MIPYVEILEKDTFKRCGVIEPSECWFELSYYEVGECEVYASANRNNLNYLKKGNFIKIPNKKYIWQIVSVQYSFTAGGARVISAKGKEAKHLLFNRIIQKPIQLPLTLTDAIFRLFNNNIGRDAGNLRSIKNFDIQLINIDKELTNTQAPRGNLGEFMTNILKTYNLGSQVFYNNGSLFYTILQGQDKTKKVRFSQSFDNLLSSTYYTSDEELATHVLVVSTVEEVDYIKEHGTGAYGIDRKEVLLSSNLSTKYTADDGNEYEALPTSLTYQNWQVEEAKQELANHKTIEEVTGEIDLTNSMYEFEKDFNLGDIITVKDEYFNFEASKQILKYTFSQKPREYREVADFG